MDTEEFQEIESEIQIEAKRGSILSILCILTFVGAGIEIISALYSFLTLDTTLNTLRSTYDFLNSAGADTTTINLKNTVSRDIEILSTWGKIGFIGKVVGGAVCLLGGFLMWNLKKKGFKIYVIGQVLSLLVTFLVLRGVGGLFASYWMAWIFLPLLFTLLYAMHLKKMN